MFFGLRNSPVIFQAIMNELLRDLINTRKVGSFINNIMVGTESKERHNESVEEILERLEKNNLYMKLEKCRWKVRKIDFLEVIIRPEGIKMEKEKVKTVLDWLVPKIGSVMNLFFNTPDNFSYLIFYFHFYSFFISQQEHLYIFNQISSTRSR